MSDDKEILKIEVEEVTEPVKAEASEGVDIAEELKGLGRQFAETLQSAWNSEERQKFESDIRQGMRSFADEVDKVIREARESETGQRIREETSEVFEKVETSEFGQKARGGLAQGLQWLSTELGKLADRFQSVVTEKSPSDINDGSDS